MTHVLGEINICKTSLYLHWNDIRRNVYINKLNITADLRRECGENDTQDNHR